MRMVRSGRGSGVRPEPDHIAFQLYTSGTTGRPKGAMFANGTNSVLLDDISVEWGFYVRRHQSGRAAPVPHGGLAGRSPVSRRSGC